MGSTSCAGFKPGAVANLLCTCMCNKVNRHAACSLHTYRYSLYVQVHAFGMHGKATLHFLDLLDACTKQEGEWTCQIHVILYYRLFSRGLIIANVQFIELSSQVTALRDPYDFHE